MTEAVPAPSAPVRGRGEEGFAGGLEGLLFGLLIFVAGTLLIAYGWGVVDTKAATSEAARQGARTFVEATDPATGSALAREAADRALSGYGRSPGLAVVGVESPTFTRCGRVTVTVLYPAPLFDLPFVGLLGRGPAVRSVHSELIDPLRGGVPGVAAC